MAANIAFDNINLEPASRWAHTEYSMEYHNAYIARHSGRAPEDPDLVPEFYNAWDYDFLWGTNDGLRGDWFRYGRATDMGHAEYAAGGTDRRESVESPFARPEDVWAFDAVQEYGLPDFDEQVAAYQAMVDEGRRRFPDQLRTGGYYKTIVSGAIQAFGWDMFLTAASEPARLEKPLDSFFRRTLFHMEAWAKTDVEVVIQHDDFVWSAGPFMSPDIYRSIIIPRYAKLWEPIHAAGKKLLFCSDGNFEMFAPDVADAGADGFIFEPLVDFEFMAKSFGQTHCLVGSAVDCRDMTYGQWSTVQGQLERTFELLDSCRGAILAVGNHLPANIPDSMLDSYIGLLKEHLPRR